MSARYIQITEANHQDNAFYTLGGAGFLTAKETRSNFFGIPEAQASTSPQDVDYFADLLDEDGFTILSEKPVSAQVAQRLLGKDLETLREEARRKLEDEESAHALTRA